MEESPRDKTITLSLAPANLNPKSNTEFKKRSVQVTDLQNILKRCNYSNLIWRNEYRVSANFESANVIIIDIDNGMLLTEAIKHLRDNKLNYAIITTKSHTETKHRFRVILFIDRPIISCEDYKRIVNDIRQAHFPKWDTNTLDLARFYFYSPSDAFFDIWLDGNNYKVDTNPSTLNMRDYVNGAFSNDRVVKGIDGKELLVSDIKEKTQIFCPFHNDNNPSAFFDYSEKSKNSFIHCSSCGKTFWMMREPISIDEALNSFWSIGKSIFQFVIQEDEFLASELGKDKFFIMTKGFEKEDRDRIFASLVNTKHIPTLRRINYIGDPMVDSTQFSVFPESGSIDVSVSASPIKVRDNDFVNKFLEDRFGAYTVNVKQWMAVYAYSNYRKLPILIVTGNRGSGKNTFAEMIMAMYPSLSQFWRGYLANFTDEVEKKLLIADEAFSDNPVHYSHLKSLIGASEHVVNKKYREPYIVKNNLNIIILSNSKIPIYVNPNELPASDSNNQFLVVDFHPLAGPIDPMLGQKLADRIGYYIRTELKKIFEELSFDGNRYSISVPITESEKTLFNNNGNDIDDAAINILHSLESIISDPSNEIDKIAKLFVTECGFLPVNWFLWERRNKGFEDTKIARRLVDIGVFKSLEKKRVQYNYRREYCFELTEGIREKLKKPIEVLEVK